MMKKKIFLGFIFLGFLLFFTFLSSDVIYAAEPEVVVRDVGYSAQYVSQSINDPIEIEAGTTKTVTFKFKNIGTKTWKNTGANYVSAYTMEPRYRNSIFQTTGWISSKQTGKMSTTVAPGQIGSLEIKLKAPTKTGDYIEKFYLASENYSWIKGGYFYIKIKVVPAIKPVEVSNTNNTVVENTKEESYELKRIILSPKNITAVGGESVRIIVGFQNIGKTNWSDFKITANNSEFADNNWLSNNLIMQAKEEIPVNSFLRKNIYFRTPVKKGEYVAKFILNIDDNKIINEIEIPVIVTADAPSSYRQPFFSNELTGIEEVDKVKQTLRLGVEPRIRVGILAPTSNFIQFRSYEDDYNVYAGTELKGILPIRKLGVVKFVDGIYSFKGGELDFTSNNFIRLEPVSNPHAVYHLPNLITRAVTWVNPESLFNKYRGVLEYRQGEIDKKMYVVNDLLIEDYVKGMAEVNKNDLPEFVRANLVAARNYAYASKGKYSFFDVLGNTYDQLYLGYEAELALPNVVKAAEATRGVFVTYNKEIVTTPYFGNSNGMTKSFSSVWGGANKPWLVPVLTNYDKGKKQLGHGVGMSQRDASLRAKNENLNFVSLLKYYYTDVEVEQLYL